MFYILLTVFIFVFHLMLRMNTDFILHISRLVLIMENPCVSYYLLLLLVFSP